MNENLEFFYWVVWYPAVCIKGFARVLLPSAAIIFLLPTSISDPWTPTPKEAFPCCFSFVFLFLCEFSNPWQVVCRSPSSYESNDSSQASIGSPSRKPGIRGSLARFSRPHPSRNERPLRCDLHRHCQVHPSTSSSFIVGELALTEASQPRRSFFATFLGPNLHADLQKFIQNSLQIILIWNLGINHLTQHVKHTKKIACILVPHHLVSELRLGLVFCNFSVRIYSVILIISPF